MTNRQYTIESVTAHSPDNVFRQLARLHREEISGGFLSSLGEDFLTQLYKSLATNPDLHLIAARERGESLGFICGAVSTAGVYRQFFRKHAWRVAPSLFWRLLSWSTIRRVAETLRYPSATQDRGLPEPEILNFCVSSKQQRRGIGKRLFAELCEEFARRGIAEIRIVTGVSQHSAQRFYDALGAQRVEEIEVHKGARSLIYTYHLHQSESRAAA